MPPAAMPQAFVVDVAHEFTVAEHADVDGVSSPLPPRLPERIDSLIIEYDGKTMSPVRRQWMHLAHHELIGSSVIPLCRSI